MTPAQAFAAYLAAISILTVTPGLDTAIVLRAAASDGKRAALMSVLGIQCGCLCWGAVVALGLGALLTASAAAYLALKLCGAAYLAWMGIGLLLRPRRAFVPGAPVAAPHLPPFVWLRRGLLTNLLNPKVGVFYVTFLPQFVPTNFPLAPTIMGLVALHLAVNMAWQTLLILGVARLQPLLRRPAIVAALDRITGLVFVGFGLRLALDRR